MDVKVYSTPTCPWCSKVKSYLVGKGIDFLEIDVSSNREAAMEMAWKTKQMGVPVVQIGDEYIVGYDPARIEELLTEGN